MWYLLKENFPQWRWRKQVPIRQYFADFASHKAKLVIEVDGGQHSEAVDARRTTAIEADGYQVIRFWNNDVLGNREGVTATIGLALADRAPPPSYD